MNTKLHSRLSALALRLYPSSYPSDKASRQNAELFLVSMAFILFISLIFIVYAIVLSSLSENVHVLLTAAFSIGGLWLFKRGALDIQRAQLVILLLVSACLFGDIYQTGGLYGGEVSWLVAIPIFGVLMLGYKTGVAWMLLAMFGVGFSLMCHWMDWVEPPPPWVVMERNAISVVMLLVVCTAGLMFMEFGYQKSLDRERETQKRQERLEQRLLQSQKRESLGVLAGGVAHDFNNLLVGITSELELALSSKDEPELVEESLQAALRAGQKASDLTHLLLAYSGKRPIAQKPHDLSKLMRDTIRLAQSTLPRTVHVKMEDDTGGDAVIRGDATQLEQVLLNVLFNAADASENEGQIDVRLTRRTCTTQELQGNVTGELLDAGEFVAVEIMDHGYGMDNRTLRRIFEPFFTTKFTGRGLGLAAAQGIVKAHNGGLFVTSEPGVGTQFCLLLRVHHEQPHETTGSHKTMTRLPALNTGMTVLVIDDEPIVRKLLHRLLTRLGCKVLSAECGEQGIAMFTEHQDTLHGIWLDLTMPDMGGDVVLREIRASNNAIPVTLVSGYSSEDVTNLLSSDPNTRFLPKPFRLSGIREMVEWQFSIAPLAVLHPSQYTSSIQSTHGSNQRTR